MIIREFSDLESNEIKHLRLLMSKNLDSILALVIESLIFAKDFQASVPKNRAKTKRPLMPSAAPIRARHPVSTLQEGKTEALRTLGHMR